MPPPWSQGHPHEMPGFDSAGAGSALRGRYRVPGVQGGADESLARDIGGQFLRTLGPVASRREALALIRELERGGWPGVFKHVTARELARNLRERVDQPSTISQGTSSLCGPATLVYRLATLDPVAYVKFVRDLYLFGRSRLGKLEIVAGTDLRSSRLTRADALAPADWIALASIRDSENWFLDYDSPRDLAPGMTLPFELASWFKKMGFGTVLKETTLVRESDEKSLRRAGELHERDYWVCLLVHEHILGKSVEERRRASMFPSHWVVLREPARIENGFVSLSVFSWGKEHYRIPYEVNALPLPITDFLDHYYGFVAAKH